MIGIIDVTFKDGYFWWLMMSIDYGERWLNVLTHGYNMNTVMVNDVQ